MRIIKETTEVTLKVKKSYLYRGKWLAVALVSNMLQDKEEKEKLGYKSLRNKFYNSVSSDKYNMDKFIGLDFINIEDPMKAMASLTLKFEVEEDIA